MNPEGLFVNTVTLYTPSETTQASGAPVVSFTTTSGVRCSIQPLSASESFSLGKDTASVFARGYFPAGTTFGPKSYVIDENSVTWKVTGRSRDTGGRGMFVTVELERQR